MLSLTNLSYNVQGYRVLPFWVGDTEQRDSPEKMAHRLNKSLLPSGASTKEPLAPISFVYLPM